MSLDLLKKRLMVRGGDAEGRMAKEKLETLKKALLYSYQAETVIKDGVEYRALINNNKLKMDYDDKLISIPFDSDFKVGDIFYWDRIGENWIIYLRQYSEDAYFRGYVRKAQHKLKWLNEYGKEIETFAAVRGPVETKVKGEVKSGIFFDVPNYTLSVIVPNNEDTEMLKRYTKVSLNGQVWEVTVADSISEPGVIDLQLIESYKNKDEDSDIVGDLVKPEIKVVTNLDGINSVEINNPIELKCDIYVNGKLNELLSSEAKFGVKEGDATINSNELVFSTTTQSIITLEVVNANVYLEFEIKGETLVDNLLVSWIIDGNEAVKSYGTTEYKIRKLVDGEMVEANGEWKLDKNDKLFSIVNINKDAIKLKWCSGMMGQLKLEYYEEDSLVAHKIVTVESLL